MGTCGCGDYAGEYKFPGPEGIVYSVGLLPRCPYCQLPRSIVIYRHDANDQDFLPMVDEASFQAYGPDPEAVAGEFSWPIETFEESE